MKNLSSHCNDLNTWIRDSFVRFARALKSYTECGKSEASRDEVRKKVLYSSPTFTSFDRVDHEFLEFTRFWKLLMSNVIPKFFPVVERLCRRETSIAWRPPWQRKVKAIRSDSPCERETIPLISFSHRILSLNLMNHVWMRNETFANWLDYNADKRSCGEGH